MEIKIGKLVKYNQEVRPDLNQGAGLVVGLNNTSALIYWPTKSACLWESKEQLEPHGQ